MVVLERRYGGGGGVGQTQPRILEGVCGAELDPRMELRLGWAELSKFGSGSLESRAGSEETRRTRKWAQCT